MPSFCVPTLLCALRTHAQYPCGYTNGDPRLRCTWTLVLTLILTPTPTPTLRTLALTPTITLTLPGAHEYGSVLSYKVGTAAAASRHHGRLDNSPLAPSASATHLARARPLRLCRCAARESTAPRPTSGRCRARGGSGGWRRWWRRGHRARRSRRRRGGRPVHAAAGLSAGGAGAARGFPHHTPGVRVVRR